MSNQNESVDEVYAAIDAERGRCLAEILESNAHLKLIVAGPGTGKTFTFKELLKQVDGPSLAITFLVVLVKGLSALEWGVRGS
ncbi:MAG: hypothetical protein JNK12_14030 [Acidimicrobiales bacterium]|nr:hypothetical protein [Acidimicrobiales bacterium]